MEVGRDLTALGDVEQSKADEEWFNLRFNRDIVKGCQHSTVSVIMSLDLLLVMFQMTTSP